MSTEPSAPSTGWKEQKPRPRQDRGQDGPTPDRPGVPAEFTDAARGPRLQKVLAEAGVASRRECETLIRRSRVVVNGQLVNDLPAFVDPANDRIEVNGERVPTPTAYRQAAREGRDLTKLPTPATAADAARQGLVYVMLNKPKRVISTTDDPHGRKSVLDLVDLPPSGKRGRKLRLFPVGRLDAESTGLILLTNDGELAQTLTHPSFEIPKQYKVAIRGKLQDDDVAKLQKGLFLADRSKASRDAKKAAMAEVKLLGHQYDRTRGDRTTLQVTLREGQNREIRRMIARLGFKVRRLHRTAIGPLKLKGLAPGEWRFLTPGEVRSLLRLVK